MSWIAGAYTAVFNSLACGQCDNQKGIRLSHQQMYEDITGDAYGDTVQDMIYQGMTAELEMELLEADAAALASLENPMAAGYALGQVGVPVVAAGKTKALVLTAQSGTSAAGGAGTGGPGGGSPATITILACCLAPGFPVTKVFNSKLRRIPLKLRMFPVNNSGTITFATQT